MAVCAHPHRCGSDGVDCCRLDCPWSRESQLRFSQAQAFLDSVFRKRDLTPAPEPAPTTTKGSE